MSITNRTTTGFHVGLCTSKMHCETPLGFGLLFRYLFPGCDARRVDPGLWSSTPSGFSGRRVKGEKSGRVADARCRFPATKTRGAATASRCLLRRAGLLGLDFFDGAGGGGADDFAGVLCRCV